ncbi:hypothetical protein OSTOST_01957 [Ostertagia ostertagi]
MVMCHKKASAEQPLPTSNISLANDTKYTIYIEKFLQRCEQDFNFIEAFGTPLFLDDNLMSDYGVNLSKEEAEGGITDDILKQNVEKYVKNAVALQNTANETYKYFEKVVNDTFNPRGAAAIQPKYKELCVIPSRLIPKNNTQFLENFKEEVEQLDKRKPPIFRQRVLKALALVKTENHKCYDIPLLWEQSQMLLYSTISGPYQGQWLICVFVALLTLLEFIATIRLSAVLSALEHSSLSSSSSNENKSPGTRRSSLRSHLEPTGNAMKSQADQFTKSQADQGSKSQNNQMQGDQLPQSQVDQTKSQANQQTKSPPYHVLITHETKEDQGNTVKEDKLRKDTAKPPVEKKPQAPNAAKKT